MRPRHVLKLSVLYLYIFDLLASLNLLFFLKTLDNKAIICYNISIIKNKGVDIMNMFVNGELVILRGGESILDYVEEHLGSDVKRAIETEMNENMRDIKTVEYERDVAWEGIRNLEQACLKGSEDIDKILFYLNNAKRISRDTLVNMLKELGEDINPNYIEY